MVSDGFELVLMWLVINDAGFAQVNLALETVVIGFCVSLMAWVAAFMELFLVIEFLKDNI